MGRVLNRTPSKCFEKLVTVKKLKPIRFLQHQNAQPREP